MDENSQAKLHSQAKLNEQARLDEKTCLKKEIEAITNSSIAQSIVFQVQNEVDTTRMQNTINMSAMGNALAKWLKNEEFGQTAQKIIEKTQLTPQFFTDAAPVVEQAKKQFKNKIKDIFTSNK